MKSIISNSFSVAAQKEVVSIDRIDNYYLCEASGSTPSVNDSRWTFVAEGGTVPVPTSAAPFLWHKYITYLTDGSHYDPIIEFKSSLGQNGIDYDLVPSHSSIIKKEDGTVSPSNVSCSMIKRNADGSAERLTTIPTGYSIVSYRDATSANYSLGTNVSTANVNVVSFVLKYGNVEVERHDIFVIAEGAQGLAGRGIQSQEVRFKALAPTGTGAAPDVPAVPENNTEWNEWKSLPLCGYSSSKCYLYKCVKTVYVDGNGTTTTDYYVEGPTVWGQDGATPFVVDIDNEMTALPVASDGKVTAAKTFSFVLKALYGTENVINNCTVSVASSLPTGFTANTSNQANPSITVAANTVPAELTEITFKIEHTTYGIRNVVFSIAAIKSGGVGEDAVIYQILPSATEISVGRTESGGYNPANVALTCGYTKRKGTSGVTTVNDVTAAFDGYNLYFRLYGRSTGWTTYYYRYYTYKPLMANFSVSSYSKVEFVICTNTSSTTTSPTGVIDRETVPVIADGLNGTSPYTLDFDKEMSSVALTSGGVTSAAFEDTISLKAFYGTTEVTDGLESVEVNTNPTVTNITIDKADLSAIKIGIDANKGVSEKTDITFTCVHPTYGTRTIVYTLVGVRAGATGTAAVLYELLPDLTQVSFGRTTAGALTPSYRDVNFSIKKTQGTSVSILTIASSGLVIRYSYSSMPTSATSGSSLTSYLRIYSSTSYTNVYVAAFLDGVLVDRETIPILKDGQKGSTGDDGNGVDEVSYARQFTQGFEAPSNTDANWTAGRTLTEAGLSQTNRYLWERKKTTYTKTSSIDYEIYLVAQFDSGVCANLLEDTAFFSDNEMDAWNQRAGSSMDKQYTGLPNNGWQLTPDWNNSMNEMLKQSVWNGNDKRKLKPNTWYTLSFYAAQAANTDLFSGSTYNQSDGGYWYMTQCRKSMLIDPGQTITFKVTGRVYNSSYAYMRVFAWLILDGSTEWKQTVSVDITATTSTTVTLSITNNQGVRCTCWVCPYMYMTDGTRVSDSSINYRGYCTKVNVDRGHRMLTYLYRSGGSTDAIQTSTPWYVDGKKVTSTSTLSDGTYVSMGADGAVKWNLSPGYKRHSITFKTSSFGTTTDTFYVLFRLSCDANYGWVCMPKLEENTIATEWIEASQDRYADDFQHVYTGPWKASTNGTASTYYLYALGVRHVVEAKKSATGDTTYFRMKKRTSNVGYCSLTEPYADTDNWERADYLKFIAADLLLSKEVITDKLTVSKIRSKNDTFVVDENGNVRATTGTFNNITVNNGKFTGNVTAISGKIGLYNIDSSGLHYGDVSKWTSDEWLNLATLYPGKLHLQYSVLYGSSIVGSVKVGIGEGADPTDTDDDGYCKTAGYFYRKMNSAGNLYRPAVKIISDNVYNRDVALLTKGAIVCQGGLLGMGRFNNADEVTVLDFSFGSTMYVYNTVYRYVYLPTLSNMQELVGLNTFCVPVRIVGAYTNSKNFIIAFQSGQTSLYFRNNNGNQWKQAVEMGAGDILELLLVYDGSNYFAQLIQSNS